MNWMTLFNPDQIVAVVLGFLFSFLALHSFSAVTNLIRQDAGIRRKYDLRRQYYTAFAHAYTEERARIKSAEEAEE